MKEYHWKITTQLIIGTLSGASCSVIGYIVGQGIKIDSHDQTGELYGAAIGIIIGSLIGSIVIHLAKIKKYKNISIAGLLVGLSVIIISTTNLFKISLLAIALSAIPSLFISNIVAVCLYLFNRTYSKN